MKVTLLFLTMMLATNFVWAIDVVGTGFVVTLHYTEPSVKVGGSPLDDLDRTEYRTGNELDGMGEWVPVPASSPMGGAPQSVPDVVIPLPSMPVETIGRIEVRACDDALRRFANDIDNCGESIEWTRPIDTLPPGRVE
jgi:hypothetical protein